MAQHSATQKSIKRELLALIHQGFAKDKATKPLPRARQALFFYLTPEQTHQATTTYSALTKIKTTHIAPQSHLTLRGLFLFPHIPRPTPRKACTPLWPCNPQTVVLFSPRRRCRNAWRHVNREICGVATAHQHAFVTAGKYTTPSVLYFHKHHW